MTIYLSIAPPPETPNTEPQEQSEEVAVEAASDSDSDTQAPTLSQFCTGGSVEPLPGGWSLPGPRDMLSIDIVRRSHHDYPAWDWGIPQGTPIYAVRGGTVTSITNFPRNWFDANCTLGGNCSRCGIGITITDDLDTQWTYCHGTHHTITGPGQHVTAGQQIMWSGNTGRSTGPHLHLSIRTSDGAQRCPQLLLESLLSQSIGLDPNTLPVTGCIH